MFEAETFRTLAMLGCIAVLGTAVSFTLLELYKLLALAAKHIHGEDVLERPFTHEGRD